MWCQVYLSTEIKYLLLSTNQFVTEFDIRIDMSCYVDICNIREQILNFTLETNSSTKYLAKLKRCLESFKKSQHHDITVQCRNFDILILPKSLQY